MTTAHTTLATELADMFDLSAMTEIRDHAVRSTRYLREQDFDAANAMAALSHAISGVLALQTQA